MFRLFCLLNQSLFCGSQSKELYLDGGMLAGFRFIAMEFCLMNKENVLRSVLAITHVHVLDTLCFNI